MSPRSVRPDRRRRPKGAVRARRACAVFLAAGLLAGCATVPVRPPLPPRDLGAEVRRLEAEVAALDAVRPGVHLDLARLYLDPANPFPDYRGALSELRYYAAQDPPGGDAREVRQWIRALEALERMRADRDRRAARAEEAAQEASEARRHLLTLQREKQELGRAVEGKRREEAALREAVRNLTRENRELQEQIERLKELDRQVELLRRNVR